MILLKSRIPSLLSYLFCLWSEFLFLPDSSTVTASKDALGLAASAAVQGSWTPVPCTRAGKQPLPRYEHAAGMIVDRLFVVGGNYSELGSWYK
jgi:hypothetical protein